MTPTRLVPHRTPLLCLALAALGGCAVGPAYERPTAPSSESFKEAAGWVPAAPADALDRGDWWAGFNDATLDGLMRRVEVSNQNVAAAAAAYEQARATIGQQRAALFPTVQLSGGATRSGGGGNAGSTSGSTSGTTTGGTTGSGSNRFQASLGTSWEPDVWGRLRAGVTSATASAEASAADLASARLAAQGQLAVAYFGLRSSDEQRRLLDETVAGYEQLLKIAQNRYTAGVVAKTDVLQARTQLANAQADRKSLEGQRAQLEHAMAVLVGEAPANFSVPAALWKADLPAVPATVPSTLLQRRPDIAAAERRVAVANEQIGIARAAYFPSLNLSASLGQNAGRIGDLFNASTSLWSLGLQTAEVLFNAGATRERVAGARAAHAEAVARYRQTVLAAFQDVEDQLAASRVLREQYELRLQAMQDADQAQAQVVNRYRSGQVGFAEVVSAQATSLSARRAMRQLVADQQTTQVSLIQALGGGWRAGR